MEYNIDWPALENHHDHVDLLAAVAGRFGGLGQKAGQLQALRFTAGQSGHRLT